MNISADRIQESAYELNGTDPPMPLSRLHKSSLVVALLTTLVMALIVLPGVYPWINFTANSDSLMPHNLPHLHLEHGWPQVFLMRGFYFGDDEEAEPIAGVPWLSWHAWKFWETPVLEFSLLALIVDGLVSVAIILGVSAAWEWRRRRRTRILQIRVLELFLLLTLFGVLLSWFAYQRQQCLAEKPHIEALEDVIEVNYIHSRSIFPSGLVHLLGSEILPMELERATLVSFMLVDWAHEYDYRDYLIERPAELFSEETLQHLKSLKRLDTIQVGKSFGAASRKQIYSACELLSHLPHLRTLDLHELEGDPPIDKAAVDNLARIRGLQNLIVYFHTDFADGALEEFREKKPNCQVHFFGEMLLSQE